MVCSLRRWRLDAAVAEETSAEFRELFPVQIHDIDFFFVHRLAMARNARIGLHVRGPKLLHSRALKILFALNSALDRQRRILVYTPVSVFAEVPTRLSIFQVHKTPRVGSRILGQPLEQ